MRNAQEAAVEEARRGLDEEKAKVAQMRSSVHAARRAGLRSRTNATNWTKRGGSCASCRRMRERRRRQGCRREEG